MSELIDPQPPIEYPRFYIGIIVDVDPEKRRYSFIAMPDRFPYVEDVSYSETSPEGFGASGHPYRMQQVMVLQNSINNFIHVKALTNMSCEYDDDGAQTDRKPQAKSKLDSFDPRVLPGDYLIMNKDGARVGLLRGGVAFFGATDMCQTLYFSEENLKRSVAQNVESFSDAGRSQTFNDDGKVTTRVVFSRDDIQTYTAAQNVPKDDTSDSEYPSYFPLQVDIGHAGDFLSAFIGEIVDKKRQNRAVINVKEDGSITLDMGPELHDGKVRIRLSLDPSTGFQFIMYDVDGENEIYRKQIAIGDYRVTEKEVISGHKFLSINKGSLFESIDHKKDVVAKMGHSVRSLVNQRVAYAIDDASTQKTTKLKNEVFPGKILGDT